MELDYNTQREKLTMPEYGRNILRMVEHIKEIPDKAKRTEQAYAIVKSMEILNPQVRTIEGYEHKLWDQLYIISGFDLDIDSPYPCPIPEHFDEKPEPVEYVSSKVRAAHYGRNIEKIVDLLADEPEGEIKTALIKSLATYMRQQYLIWNKDSVSDETIFNDIEKISEGRIIVPEGLSLNKISSDANFARPTLGLGNGGSSQKNKGNRKNFHKKKR